MGAYRYFSSVRGKAVQRHGTRVFIGAVKTARGFVWDEAEVVRVPEEEYLRNVAAYRASVATGCLLERTEADYDAQFPEGTRVPSDLEQARDALEVAPAPAVDPDESAGPQESARPRAKKRGRES